MREFRANGIAQKSRNGDVLRLRGVVMIIQENPWERVYLNPIRDSNPFFHLVEAMAMLADRNSAPFLSYFARNMQSFSDDGLTFNAFYGTRARSAFGLDQLEEVIRTLIDDKDSRQAVVQLWHPTDLLKPTKDKACNMTMVFSVDGDGRVCMTTFNRSNDAVWGYFGANAVHFSFFHEYVAERVSRPMGPWTHVSNNFHGYLSNEKFTRLMDWSISEDRDTRDPYIAGTIVHHPMKSGSMSFRHDLDQCMAILDAKVVLSNGSPFVSFDHCRHNPFLTEFGLLMQAFFAWKSGRENILAESKSKVDWLFAGKDWMERRMKA